LNTNAEARTGGGDSPENCTLKTKLCTRYVFLYTAAGNCRVKTLGNHFKGWVEALKIFLAFSTIGKGGEND